MLATRHLGPAARAALIATVVVTMLLTACTRMVAGTAQSAPPRAFPDLDQFTQVNDGDYTSLQHWGNTVYFKAPNGVYCSVSGYFSATCTNVDFPVPAADSATAPADGCKGVEPTFVPTKETGNTYRFFHAAKPCDITEPDIFKDLPAGSKVSLDARGTTQFTCAVGDDLVACIDPAEKHGFVLQPSDSWTF